MRNAILWNYLKQSRHFTKAGSSSNVFFSDYTSHCAPIFGCSGILLIKMYRETVALTERGLARMPVKSSSVIGLVYIYKANQTRFECRVLFS